MSSGSGTLRISTFIEQEAAKYLDEREIPKGEPLMAERIGKRSMGDVQLTTNVYGLIMKEQLLVYRYDVTIRGVIKKSDGTDAIVDLTKKAKSDAVFIDLRDRCRDVMLAFKELQTGKFFKNERCFYYDLQSILFSLDELEIGEKRDFEVPAKVLPGEKFSNFDKAVITIRPVVEPEVLKLGDFSFVSRNLLLSLRSLQQFLDIATSQYAMFHSDEHITFSTQSSYLIDPSIYKLSDDTLFEDTRSYLAFGAQKSSHIIEGPAQKCAASLIVSTKKTPFHATVNLVDKVQGLVRDASRLSDVEHRKLISQLKGLFVETKHTKRLQRFEICGLTIEDSNTKMICVNNVNVSVQQYFLDKYQIQLTKPNLPLVEVFGRNKSTNYVPMELCYVADNQRVKTNQQTPKMTQLSIRKCAVPPSISREQNECTAASLHLWDSEWLKCAKINVPQKPLNLSARLIDPPSLEFLEGSQRVNTNNFTWLGKKYFAPANCKIWAAYAFLDPRDRFNVNELEHFLMAFVGECKARGVRISDPAEWKVLKSDYQTIRETFKYAAQNDCEFIFTVHSDSGDSAHADIKYSERLFGVVSQCVRLTTLRTLMAKNQRLTLGNIVNKTNMKLNGLNYSLSKDIVAREILGTETLYIGFGMNHPAGGLGFTGESDSVQSDKDVSEGVSIVGYAANIGANNEFDFVGDFVFQAALRDEKANVIGEIVTRCLEYYQHGRGKLPKRLILYRNGCSEGQYRMVLQYEIPLIKHILEKHGCYAKVTLIVVNKLQNIRLYNREINTRDRVPDQNIKPGVVVDHTIVHPEFAEFFLNAHRALQGTTRTPKYVVLYDDNKFQLEQLENISFHLCFGHQIVFMPTSLPSPVYIANRYAERGRMLYQRWIEHDKRNLNYHQLTDVLCYYKSQGLFGRRINA